MNLSSVSVFTLLDERQEEYQPVEILLQHFTKGFLGRWKTDITTKNCPVKKN